MGFLWALAAALLLGAAGSASAGTLDQQQTTSNVDLGLFSDISGAQTFTAGVTGAVDQADLDLLRAGTPPAVSVEIRTASAGQPTATVLASGSIPPSAIGSTTGAFVPVTFTPPALVTAGTQYAVVAYSPGSMGNAAGWLNQGSGDPYSGGDLFFNNVDPLPPGGANWLEAEDGDDDFAFKTYVVPATTSPAPGPTPARKRCKKHRKKHRSAESAKKKRKCGKKKHRRWTPANRGEKHG